MVSDDELELTRAVELAEQNIARLEAALTSARNGNAEREQRLVAGATREHEAASARVQGLRARLRTTEREARRLEAGAAPSVWTLNLPERLVALLFTGFVFAVTAPAHGGSLGRLTALGVMALAWLAAYVAGSWYESGSQGAAGAGPRLGEGPGPRAGAGAPGPAASEPKAPAVPRLDAHPDAPADPDGR